MDPSLLRKWDALSDMPEENLVNIAYMVVYGQRVSYLTGKGRSVMYITRDTKEVYGVGWNSLIGWVTKGLPMAPGGAYVDLDGDGAVKVSVLDGVKVDKLVVGWHTGAALAENGTLHVWGTTREAKVLSRGTIFFYIYSEGVETYCCPSIDLRFYEKSNICGVNLSKCSRCGWYASSTTETPNKPIKACVLYKFYQMECPKCEFPCASVTIGKNEVNYCRNCNILPEPHEYVATTEAITRKIPLQSHVKVKELSCGKSFIVLWTSSNDLLIIGSIGNEYYEGSANIPGHVVLSAVSCGGEHIAIISSQGELYTCGKGVKGQLGYEWEANMDFVTFRKVPVQGIVRKVCCGHSTTVCLMANGSILCFGAGLKLISGECLSVNHSEDDVLITPTKITQSSIFIDIANSHLSNIYWAKTDASMVYTWGQKTSSTHHLKLLFGVTSLMEAMANEQGCLAVEIIVTPTDTSATQATPVSMYGKHKFSDLTLMLADGDFPVHKLILYNESTFFREILEQDSATNILNMTHHNPTAFKSLLKYFYKIPIGTLQPADLVDTHILAVNYKETEIANDTYQKLKAVLNNETVLTILQKSIESDNDQIMRLCENYVKSPQFKQTLVSLISNNMENTLAVLRMESNK